jgi:membrane-bound ClpP family serine protease
MGGIGNQHEFGELRCDENEIAENIWHYGILSAAFSLLLSPEIVGSVAIILGAYQMKMEPDRSFGLIVVVLGIVCMLIGIYVTSYLLLINLIIRS